MIIQGTPEWFQQRLGRVTASRVADIVAKTKTGYGASRANYMAQLVAERLTGKVAESYTNAAMQWGIDTEAEARLNYEFMQNVTVEEVGFVPHPVIGDAGASPDGLVGDDGLVECKCPNTWTHIETLLAATVPAKYVTQMQMQMACTGRQWCDYVSYDPRMPESMRLFIQRVPRSHGRIQELEAEVVAFLDEVRMTVHRLRARYEPEAAEPISTLLAG